MENNFDNKIKDFAGWSKTAFELFNKGYYADSLTNMRKSGESACKVMILYRYSGKASNDKIAYKNYKELIEVVIRDNLAPRKVINWLETLQIHGNEATHDTHVMQEQSYYGIIALRLLIYWIYIELLNSSVPEVLIKGISQIKEKSDDVTSNKKFGEERNKLIKEKEELEKKLNDLKGKKEIESEKIISLTSELNNSESKIKELDTAQQRIKTLENELSRFKIETEELKQKNSIRVVVNKKNRLKITLFVLLFVSLIIGGILIFKYTGNQHNTTIPLTSNNDSLKQNADSFCVLVLPFIILQDNPNIKINFEEALISYLSREAKKNNLPLRIIYKTDFKKSPVSGSDVYAEGIKEKAFLIFYGELYEPISSNDSVQLNIKKMNILNGKQTDEDFGIKSFYKLSDSSAVKIMQIFEFAVNLSIAEDYMNNKKFSEALALIYSSKPILKSQKYIYSNDLAVCQYYLKNYDAAIIEMEKAIKAEPDSSLLYFNMANFYNNKNDFINSERYYRKYLQMKPKDIEALLDYSLILIKIDSNNVYKSKKTVLEAIKLDSSNANSWFYLSNLNNIEKDYNSAKINLLKTIKLNPNNINAKYELAKLLITIFNEFKNAETYLNQILKVDSNFGNALYMLANIYNNTDLYNPSKAEYLLKKYNSINKKDSYSTNYGLGVLSYNKKDYKAALTFFNKAYSEKNNDKNLCYLIGNSYYFLRDYTNTEKYLLRANRLDSLGYETNFNLGNFYLIVDKPFQNIDKAIFYFERELKTYPYDTLTLQWLGTIYNDKKNYKKLKEIGNRLYSLTPNSSYVHKIYGYIAELDSNFTKALFHYKKVIEISPDDPDCYSKAALLMLNISPQKYWKEAIVYAAKAVELDPQNAFNNYMYSKTLIYAGDYNKSTEYYYKALEIDPSLKDAEFEQLLKTRGL